MKTYTDKFNRCPTNVISRGHFRAWFTLGWRVFSRAKSSSNSFYIKSNYYYRLGWEKIKPLRRLADKFAFSESYLQKSFFFELTKTLPSPDLPKEHQFVIRYDNLEQLTFVLWSLTYKRDKSHNTWITRYWRKEKLPFDNKTGIYMIQNKVTQKKYIGKSLNLIKRLENYCSYTYLDNNRASSNIYRNIIKFGFQNFSFSILEYCEEKDLSLREQYYIDLIKPQYNIRKSVHKTKSKSSPAQHQ